MSPRDQAASTQEECAKYVPNLAALHINTTFWVYREKMDDGRVEITIIYREPDAEKYRIDLEYVPVEPRPENMKITKMGKAVDFVA